MYAGRDTSINEGRPELYAAAFRDFGADVETLPADEAAARLRARPELTVPLAAALDDWARKVRKHAPIRRNGSGHWPPSSIRTPGA